MLAPQCATTQDTEAGRPGRANRPPKLSVCIPVFNPGPYLSLALNSVLTQDYDDFEVIVVDDCSTQPLGMPTVEGASHRFALYRNQHNLGLVENWNQCLRLPRGEYIALFHQDDIMLASNLAAKADLLDLCGSVGLVHSDVFTIDDKGSIIGGHWATQPSNDRVRSGILAYEYLATHGNHISCPSVVARAECYRTLGGFDPRLPFTCDLEMWMRIATSYDIGYIDSPLVASRSHPAQATQRYSGWGHDVQEVRRALRIALVEHAPAGVSPTLRQDAKRNLINWAWAMGRWKLRQGHWRAALGYFEALFEALVLI